MELSRAERGALMLIVRSGLAAAPAFASATSDGHVVMSDYCFVSRRDGRRKGYCYRIRGEDLPAVSAEDLRARGLVDLWPVGVVVGQDFDRRVLMNRPAVLVTLTPAAAELLGVRLSEKADGQLRWTKVKTDRPWEEDESAVTPAPETPYPAPIADLAPLPKVVKPGERRRRKAG